MRLVLTTRVRRPVVVAVAAIACALACVTLPAGPGGAVRLVFALPLVALLPGLGIVLALDPGGTDAFRRLALAVGVSLAVAVCIGLIMNVAPSAFMRTSWALSLALVTVAGAAAAACRSPSTPRRSAYRPTIRLQDGALLALAVVVTASAIAVARVGADRSPQAEGVVVLAAHVVQRGGERAITVIVRNGGGMAERFRLVVSPAGAIPRIVHVDVRPNGSWRRTYGLPGKLAVVTVVLYHDPSRAPLRRVKVWP